jgi:large subunit ribosomal protein L32
MPVPKRKTPKSATRSRKSANMKLAEPARSTCPRCGSVKRPHVVCGTCGWYGGRQAVDVD